MKSGIIIFNAILLVLIGILFYLHFSAAPKTAAAVTQTGTAKATPAGDFRIAYFNMDSLEVSFVMVQEANAEVARKQEAMTAEKMKMEQAYKNKWQQYQSQAKTMNQVQSESATKDMMQLRQQMEGRTQEMEQEYQDFYTRKRKDVSEKIEAFLKEYNTEKHYAYIVSYEPGLFYYRDSAYDITADVIAGLNKAYKKK